MTIAAVRLNHAVLFVSDVERAVRFWTEAFDMEVAAREPPSCACAGRATTTTSACSASVLPRWRSRTAQWGFTTSRGRSTPSRSSRMRG